MFARTVAIALLSLALTASASAQEALILRDSRPLCRMRMTEILRVPAPGLGATRMLGDCTGAPLGPPVTLDCKNWQGGRNFTDALGRRWQLVSPIPMLRTPEKLSGCLIKGPDGTAMFMTTERLMFVELPKP